MKISACFLSVILLLAGWNARADITFQYIQDTNAIVTGIRSEDPTTDNVVITSRYTTGATTSSGIYEGSLGGRHRHVECL